MKPVEEYVDSEAGRGILDSEGVFTVDSESARQKSARHRFKKPGVYVLKFLQTAVALRCSKFDVKVGMRDVRFSFRNEDLSQERAERAKAHFWLGVEAAAPISKTLSIARDGVETPPEALDFRTAGQTVVKIHRGFTSDSLLSLVHRASEHKALSRPAVFAATEVHLDGWPIPRGWGPLDGKSKLGYVPTQKPFYLLESYIKTAKRKGLPVFHFPRTKWNKEHVEPVLNLSEQNAQEDFHRCTMALAVSSKLETLARVCFVSDGLIVGSLAVDLGFPGLTLVASARGMVTDLSTLRLVRNERFYQRCEALLQPLPRLARSLRDNSDLILRGLDRPYFAERGSLGQLDMQSDYSPGAVSLTPDHLRRLLPRPSKVAKEWPRL
jgi:hypothetical protein